MVHEGQEGSVKTEEKGLVAKVADAVGVGSASDKVTLLLDVSSLQIFLCLSDRQLDLGKTSLIGRIVSFPYYFAGQKISR